MSSTPTKPTAYGKVRKEIVLRRRCVLETEDNPGRYHIIKSSEEHIVRTNAFGVKETLDRKSYEDALNGEKELNRQLEEYLNETVPKRTNRKLHRV